LSADEGKDSVSASPALRRAVQGALSKLKDRGGKAKGGKRRRADPAKVESEAPTCVQVVRKSFDARLRRGSLRLSEPTFSYVVDVAFARAVLLPTKAGQIEPTAPRKAKLSKAVGQGQGQGQDPAEGQGQLNQGQSQGQAGGASETGAGVAEAPRVIVVGAGPAGLFAALALAEAGYRPTVLERGQPVEQRGRDIGALLVRRVLQRESNLCFGEGGAGTWSDGKLATQIGRNSGPVRSVLETLVAFGAPERILVDSKPHLGTDRMVMILKSMRSGLERRGVVFEFGARVDSLLFELEPSNWGASNQLGASGRKRVAGVRASRLLSQPGPGSGSRGTAEARECFELAAEHVVLAAGHSARELYTQLVGAGVPLEPKGFAVGFRIEHPQTVINEMRLEGGCGEGYCGFMRGRVRLKRAKKAIFLVR